MYKELTVSYETFKDTIPKRKKNYDYSDVWIYCIDIKQRLRHCSA